MTSISDNTHTRTLQSYYQWHAHIYDATRWSFLFGRNTIIRQLPSLPPKANILEVGCGTGHNLKKLIARYPKAEITGIDLSPAMIEVASRKVDQAAELRQEKYPNSELRNQSFDLILLSYSLTMMETPMKLILNQLKDNLTSEGIIAVVDFHHTDYLWFLSWMQRNHVDMDESLLSSLRQKFDPLDCSVHPVYGGLWSYFLFVGRNCESNLSAKSS